MFGRDRIDAPSHFRAYVRTKLHWPDVLAGFSFRPQTTHLSLRMKAIDAATEASLRRGMLLLACELFEKVFVSNRRSPLLKTVGEEILAYECLLFAASYVVASLDRDEQTYDLAILACHGVVDDYERMCLLHAEELENASLARFELYSSNSQDRDAHLCSSFCRVLHYLAQGEHFSEVAIRFEDPPAISYLPDVLQFAASAQRKLQEMVSLIVKREMAEENGYDS